MAKDAFGGPEIQCREGELREALYDAIQMLEGESCEICYTPLSEMPNQAICTDLGHMESAQKIQSFKELLAKR